MKSPLVSIVIVSYNTRDILRDCLRSVYAQTTIPFEIIVVDNVSHDGTVTMLKEEFPEVHVVANTENVGFTKGNNQGIALVQGAYTLLLNPDTIILNHAIDSMVAYMAEHDDIGCVGPHTYNADGRTTQGTVLDVPRLSGVFHTHIPVVRIIVDMLRRIVPAIPRVRTVHEYAPEKSGIVEVVKGSCMLFRTNELRAVGGMNEQLFMYSEEIDLCEKVKRLLRKYSWYHRSASIIHLGGQSTQQVMERATERYVESITCYFALLYPSRSQHVLFRWITWLGSAWRYMAWRLVFYSSPAKRAIASVRSAEHRIMLRWLWSKYHV